MPFVSQQQRRWMWSQHPDMAARWEAHTPKGVRLPRRVRPRRRKRKAVSMGGPGSGRRRGENNEHKRTLGARGQYNPWVRYSVEWMDHPDVTGRLLRFMNDYGFVVRHPRGEAMRSVGLMSVFFDTRRNYVTLMRDVRARFDTAQVHVRQTGYQD